MSSVELDESIYIACPDRKNILRKISVCSECEYFKGITKIIDDPRAEAHNAHAVICVKPIVRSLTKVSED